MIMAVTAVLDAPEAERTRSCRYHAGFRFAEQTGDGHRLGLLVQVVSA
jgi:hypothetical protein